MFQVINYPNGFGRECLNWPPVAQTPAVYGISVPLRMFFNTNRTIPPGNWMNKVAPILCMEFSNRGLEKLLLGQS